MAASQDEKDPVAAMFDIPDEAERSQPVEAEVTLDPPADKAERERDETGKFKGKEEKAADAKADEKAHPKEEPKVEPKAEEKQTVPLATFLEKTNKLKEQLEAETITRKQFEQRLAELEKKAAPAAPPEPDFVEDPKAYVDHKLTAALKGIEEANKKAEESGKKVDATAQAAAERDQLQRVMGEIAQLENAYVGENPDYYDALEHVRGVRIAQMREFNPNVTQDEITQIIRHEETNLAVQLRTQGRNPAQVVHNLAKHYGYQKKAAAPPQAEVAKLPDPKSNRLPPDQTLGSGAGAVDTEPTNDKPDAIDDALASLFRKRA